MSDEDGPPALASDDPSCWQKLVDDYAMATGESAAQLNADFFAAYRHKFKTCKKPKGMDFSQWRYQLRVAAWEEVAGDA